MTSDFATLFRRAQRASRAARFASSFTVIVGMVVRRYYRDTGVARRPRVETCEILRQLPADGSLAPRQLRWENPPQRRLLTVITTPPNIEGVDEQNRCVRSGQRHLADVRPSRARAPQRRVVRHAP